MARLAYDWESTARRNAVSQFFFAYASCAPPEKLARLRQVRTGPAVARGRGGALDQVRGARDLRRGAFLRGAPRLLPDEEGDSADDESD
jgi:hypothetical protein